MERDEAEKEHRKYKAKVKMDLEIKDQVRDGTSISAAVKNLMFFLMLMYFNS